MKIVNVCGARPNFMKIAPLMRAYQAYPVIQPLLVHTGQHYDHNMSDLFFKQLNIPEPDLNLGVCSASHAVQTAEIMTRFEPVILEHKPDWVVVVGDVNSTIACALTAVKLGVRVAHVEAGLRSFDRTMPEEINRLLTDAVSDLLFVTERSGEVNLLREGVDPAKIRFVGNVMIDTLVEHRKLAETSNVLNQLELKAKSYVTVTLHRPSNVDNPRVLGSILDALSRISNEMPVVFAVHPRTRKRLESGELGQQVARAKDLRLIEPLGYLDFLKLMSESKAVLTDSGGMQEETTILNVACLTLRKNTERPVTIEQGTNRLVDPESAAILAAWEELKRRPPGSGKAPEGWDGQAAGRIVKHLVEAG